MSTDALTHNPMTSTEIEIRRDNRLIGRITEVGAYWNLEVPDTGTTVFCADAMDALRQFYQHMEGQTR